MMSTRAVHDGPTETNVVGTRTASLCTQGRVGILSDLLRTLEELRRRLTRQTRGCEGAFPGFDALDVSSWPDGIEERPIQLIATVVSDTASSQTVEFVAVECLHTNGMCHAGTDALLRARGTTVALARRRAAVRNSNSHQFVIAPPHR
jgi:hypothetical protein